MKSDRLAEAFQYIDNQFLELVDTERSRKKPFWTYGGLVAAGLLLAVILFSVGAMANNWFGLRELLLNQRGIDWGDPNTRGLVWEDLEESGENTAGKGTWQNDVIGLAGAKGSKEAMALEEWQAFLESYDRDGSVLREADSDGISYENEGLYFVYSQEMDDKLKEIAAKYGLKLHTQMDIVCLPELAYRVGGTFWTNEPGPACGYIYEDGSFQVDLSYHAEEGWMTDYQLRRVVKGTLDEVALGIGDIEEYEEWIYQTRGGEQIILAMGSVKALILGDFEDCFVTANILEGTDEGFTKEKLEQLAAGIDFSILKAVKIPDMRGDVAFEEDFYLLQNGITPSRYAQEDEATAGQDGNGQGSASDGTDAAVGTAYPRETSKKGRYGAYYALLYELYHEKTWPDGTKCEFNFEGDMWRMEDNDFALSDVDGDGEEELIIMFPTSTMGGMEGRVYGYDAETESCYLELQEWPGFRFWDNGVVEVMLSHNHGPACESLWPFSIYKYDASEKRYIYQGTAYGFDKELSEELSKELGEDYTGKYPEEVDEQGYGTVYYIMTDGYSEDHPISREAYEEWLQQYYNGAVTLTLPYWKMTEQNIWAINVYE